MTHNTMKIGKAYCRELGRTVDIEEAGIHYFAQIQPRDRFSFYCSSPECELMPVKVEILGVNYRRVPIDLEGRDAPELADEGSEEDDPVHDPYYRTKIGHEHSDECQWMIDRVAEQEYIKDGATPEERNRRRKRVARGGLVEETSFLVQEEETVEINQADFESEGASSNDSSQSVKRRRRRIDRAKARIARPKKSPYFSGLVSSFMTVMENVLYSEPLNVIGIGHTTWGDFFKPIKKYSPEASLKHAYRGNAYISTLPQKFDWSDGLPNAVILTFFDEITIGDKTDKPSIMITPKDIEDNAGSYVLMEAVKSAMTDDKYKHYLKCYFYGRIEYEPRNAKKPFHEKTNPLIPKVKPLRLNTFELRRVDQDNENNQDIDE